MRKKLFVISIIVILLFSCLSMSFASDDIQAWAEVSSDAIIEEDPNVSQNMIDASASINSKLNETTNNEIKSNTINTVETSEDLNVSQNMVDAAKVINEKLKENNVKETSALYQNRLENTELVETSATVKENPLKLTCGGAILIEQNSGEVLYDYNAHEKLRPASVTKVMTILLIMEALDSGRIKLTDKIPCSQNASNMGGSQIWLDTTEELTVDEMLKAICVVSANDCTVAMAEYLEGSEDAFVAKMNEKAKALGMNDTNFVNCHGIDADGHETSPYDIALMSRELLTKHPSITNYTTIYMDSLRDGKSGLVNTNKLVRNYDGCTGLKTGSTSIALFNLSASATRNDLSLIAVIMKAETSQVRFEEARKLLDYGFANYQYKSLAVKGEVAGNVNVNKGLKNSTEAVFSDNFGLILKKSDSQDIEQNLQLNENISAPINIGTKLGEVQFKSNGELLGVVDLVANEEIEKYGFGTMCKKIFTSWYTLLRIE